jgi:hypothetical protein
MSLELDHQLGWYAAAILNLEPLALGAVAYVG